MQALVYAGDDQMESSLPDKDLRVLMLLQRRPVTTLCRCGGLIFSACQVPTKLLYHSPYSTGLGEGIQGENETAHGLRQL